MHLPGDGLWKNEVDRLALCTWGGLKGGREGVVPLGRVGGHHVASVVVGVGGSVARSRASSVGVRLPMMRLHSRWVRVVLSLAYGSPPRDTGMISCTSGLSGRPGGSCLLTGLRQKGAQHVSSSLRMRVRSWLRRWELVRRGFPMWSWLSVGGCAWGRGWGVSSRAMSAPAGWYPDAASGGHLRWWDGVQWGAFAPPAQVVAPKDMTVAYVLAIFLGGFGAHQFYLRHVGIAVTQLILTLLGWLTSWLIIGWFLVIPVWIWVFVDLFLIPGWVRRANGLPA